VNARAGTPEIGSMIRLGVYKGDDNLFHIAWRYQEVPVKSLVRYGRETRQVISDCAHPTGATL